MFAEKPGRLIVSCQPSGADSPLNHPAIMAAMAAAAERAGATALRVESPEHVAAVRAASALPVIGLWKREDVRGNRVITPNFEAAKALAEAGANVIAVDASASAHPVPGLLALLIQQIHEELSLPVLADVSNPAEGIRAEGYGADMVATTLSGYTPHSPQQDGPDLDLVRELVASLSVPVIAEGRYVSPELARAALEAGAAYVVVGGAITAPDRQATRFVLTMAAEPTAEPTAETFWGAAAVRIARLQATQGPAVREAAGLMAQAITAGGAVHVLGAWPAGDPAGQPVPVHVATVAEFPVHPADIFILAPDRGGDERLAALALGFKRQGHRLIVLTALDDPGAVAHQAVRDAADVVIDNGAPTGDALLAIPWLDQQVGSISGITTGLIAEALIVETLRALRTAGLETSP